MNRRTFNTAALAALAASAFLSSAHSGYAADAAWPTRPVRILVGFPGGSTPDMVARTLAEPLSRALGQPVIVENRAGASGNIAADQVAKATDDHTIGVVVNGNLTTAKLLNPRLPYDPATDFSPISLLAVAPLVLVAPANLPDGRAFIATAAQSGDKWSYGSVGTGSVGHLGMELLKAKVPGLAAVHVPFKGNPEVVTSLIGGDIQMALVPAGVAMPQVKAGKLRAIGVTSEPSAAVREVPSLSEAGVNDFRLEIWAALIGPARLSPAAQQRLQAQAARIFQDDEVRHKLLAQGWQTVGSSPAALKARIDEEATAMKSIISAQDIQLE